MSNNELQVMSPFHTKFLKLQCSVDIDGVPYVGFGLASSKLKQNWKVETYSPTSFVEKGVFSQIKNIMKQPQAFSNSFFKHTS